ncbi:MAG: hypothetical protein FJ225_03815 [Lentisphaerae bacterium]|nr:hypothetical protein [Lentisphaerota bacterium]
MNVVGYGKVVIGPGKLVLVATTFETFGDSTLNDLVGNQLPNGSGAFIWDRVSKTYKTSTLGRGGWSGTNVIIRGDAFWLKNTGSTTNVVTLKGEVPYYYNDSATTTVSQISGIDAVAYAYPVDAFWTNTALAKAAAVNDALYIWNGGSYDVYTKGRAGWSTPAGFKIAAGRAFFVKTAAAIDWTEVAPYNLD